MSEGAMPLPGLVDRVGLSWRPELSGELLARLSDLELLEIRAEDFLRAGAGELDFFRELSTRIPLLVHSQCLGPVSTGRIEEQDLAAIAALLDSLGHPLWSEHCGFTRTPDFRLARPLEAPRTRATLGGALRNLRRVRNRCGSLPLLENISATFDPPGSSLSEADFLGELLERSGADFLLNLHSLYARARNLGEDPLLALERLPLHRVRQVHLSGGHWKRQPGSGRQHLLDDRSHDIPDSVFFLLERLAMLTRRPLLVVIERDNHFPGFPFLLAELERARAAVRRGRCAWSRPVRSLDEVQRLVV